MANLKCSLLLTFIKSNCPEVFSCKGVVRNFAKFTRKHLCQSLLFNKVTGLPEAWDFFKKETVALVFSGEFWEIFKNTFLKESLWWLLLFYQELFASKIVRNGSCHVFILTSVAYWKNIYFWNKNKKILYFIFI